MKEGKNFLVILGPPGVGKTYFCSALIEWIYGKVPTFRYWHEREFFTRIRGVVGASSGEYSKEVENMLDDHFVMYDDLGCCGINDWRKEILLSMIDIRYESAKPTVITTNLTKKNIHDGLGDRSASRLFDRTNLIIDMSSMPDRRQI
jgi:DNA replication protein DnaC